MGIGGRGRRVAPRCMDLGLLHLLLLTRLLRLLVALRLEPTRPLLPHLGPRLVAHLGGVVLRGLLLAPHRRLRLLLSLGARVLGREPDRDRIVRLGLAALALRCRLALPFLEDLVMARLDELILTLALLRHLRLDLLLRLRSLRSCMQRHHVSTSARVRRARCARRLATQAAAQPSTARHSPAKPGTAGYSWAQPGTARPWRCGW